MTIYKSDPNYKGFDSATEDVYMEIAANTTIGTWASNVKSIVTPSVRLAGLLNVSDTQDLFASIMQLSTHGIISSLGSFTFSQMAKIKRRADQSKPRLKIRTSTTVVDAITGKRDLQVPLKQREKLFELLAQFDVTFEVVIYNPKARDYVTSQLNLFARRILIEGNEGVIVTEREYRPQAVSIVEFRDSPTGHPAPVPETKLVPLTPLGHFHG